MPVFIVFVVNAASASILPSDFMAV